MQHKPALKFYLGLVFLGLGSYKLYQQYGLDIELSTLQLVGSFFLVGLGLFRVYQYWNFKQKSNKP